MLSFIGTSEIVIVVMAALLLFGADRMPDFFKTFYKGVSEVRKAADEIKREFTESANEVKQEIKSIEIEAEKDMNYYPEVKQQALPPLEEETHD